MNFNVLKQAVAQNFELMQRHNMFRVDVSKDELWSTYLSSFPAGTNPLMRERTEHDCNCCKQFIRAVGDAVAVIDGKLVSIWDVKLKDEPAYQAVADALSNLVKTATIKDPFLHYERTAGTDKNFEQVLGGQVKTWNHFFVNIKNDFVLQKDKIASVLSEKRSQQSVFYRALKEINLEQVDIVLELIAQGSLYRGDEHKSMLLEFRKHKAEFDSLSDGQQALYAWTAKTFGSVLGIRNTVIGTLLVDLATLDVEDAVKAYEAKVAPANYKRPSALITKRMIEEAKQKLNELGLTSALERRFAKLTDLTINNILFADRGTRAALSGDVFDELATVSAVKAKSFDKVEEVTIDKFIKDILPRAQTVEVLLENRHNPNFASLIAPVDPTAGNLFKWDNNFSWSYAGEFADSIKERVKRAGGSVVGDLCCRLAWDYTDDLDLHMYEPNASLSGYNRGNHVYYGIARTKSVNGGELDVDANGRDGIKKEPVENIFYTNSRIMRDGLYELKVNNYNRRSGGTGFVVELELNGETITIGYDKKVGERETVDVATFKVEKGNISLLKSLPASTASKETWGLKTQTFHKVNAIMLSPNFWDEKAVGNKHYFFMLEGCKNDGTARGFFNEFLKEELNKHRKVFEAVGSKTVITDANGEQLSGLGFSSTQRNTLVCRVKGSITRTLKIIF